MYMYYISNYMSQHKGSYIIYTECLCLHMSVLIPLLQVWDITTGHCLHTLKGSNKHQSAVTSLQFTDNFVVTSSDDGSVKLWDLKTGEFVRNLVNLESGGNGQFKY